MFKGTFKHDNYLHFRALTRANRAGKNLDLQITFAFSVETQYPHPGDWKPIYDWLRDYKIIYFTWSPFTDEHRRYFSFVNRKDAMLFKLIWADKVKKPR